MRDRGRVSRIPRSVSSENGIYEVKLILLFILIRVASNISMKNYQVLDTLISTSITNQLIRKYNPISIIMLNTGALRSNSSVGDVQGAVNGDFYGADSIEILIR